MNNLNKMTAQKIVERIFMLKPNSTNHWGTMTVTEMMYHFAKVNAEILQGTKPDEIPTVQQKITKFIGLRVLPKLPQGVKTNARYFAPRDINLDFEDQKEKLILSIVTFASYEQPIYGCHPFFGPLNTEEWRCFVWKHLDHHLRQFGV